MGAPLKGQTTNNWSRQAIDLQTKEIDTYSVQQ
jgi:hypothetical protein